MSTYLPKSTSFVSTRTDLAGKLFLTSEFTPDDTEDANKAILHSTTTRTQLFPSESSKILKTEINRYKDNSLYLSPTTKKLHDSLEKASIKSQQLIPPKV